MCWCVVMEKQSPENVELMIDVNLKGTFNLIKAALPLMKVDRLVRGQVLTDRNA